MAYRLHCPGLWHFSCVVNGRTPKLLISFLGALGVICILGILLVEYHSRMHVDEARAHALRHKLKISSVAVATDVSDNSLHYGVVIDCGSSGSRVYVYFWTPHDGMPGELLTINPMLDSKLQPVVKKIEPGLSTFAERPADASDYLKPLLKFAASHVPQAKHKNTPLYILATAGMRMLPLSQQTAIIDDLRVDVPMEVDFLFSKSHVEVITGKQEGIYAWVAMNYVLGRFEHSPDAIHTTQVAVLPTEVVHNSHNSTDDPLVTVEIPGKADTSPPTHVRKRSVGIIDMGGGSLQIAMEVPKSVRFISPQEDLAKSLLAEFSLGCSQSDLDHSYRVYVTTFLGFGANAARKRYENLVLAAKLPALEISNATSVNSTQRVSLSTAPSVLHDPCLPEGMVDMVTLDGGRHMSLKGTGNWASCQALVRPLLNQSVPCMKKPCSINGVFQPEIDFHNSEFFGFSEFWYTMEDVFRMGGHYEYNKFIQAAKEYCSTSWSTLEGWYKKNLYPKADQHRFKFQCFKASWMTLVLHEGLKFPKTYKHFTSAQLVNGKEVQWTLGALLYRTRYLPLREIQKQQFEHFRPAWLHGHVAHSQYILLLCFFVVVAAIFLYLRRLRIVKTPSLSRVPSMSYFMTEEGQTQLGVRVETAFP